MLLTITNATSLVLTEGQEAHRLAGPGNSSPRSDGSGFDPQEIATDASCMITDEAVAPSSQYEAPMRSERDASNPAIALSLSAEIADSDDGRAIDDRTDKYPEPFGFDVFVENNNVLVSEDRLLAKR